jgi:hypothetical protein
MAAKTFYGQPQEKKDRQSFEKAGPQSAEASEESPRAREEGERRREEVFTLCAEGKGYA